MNRYPDPDATLLRRRIAERYERSRAGSPSATAPARSCSPPPRRSASPGDEIVYAWPSFSMYPYLPALTGAREIRVPLAEGERPRPRGDGRRGDRRHPAADRLQPEQPDRDPHPRRGDRRLLRARPPARDDRPRRGLHRVPDRRRPRRARLDLLADFPNLVVLRTFSKVYGLAGLRVGYAIGSAKFRAAVDAVRQPFSVNALAQAAGAEAVLHSDDVARRVESTLVERVRVESGLDELGVAHAESQANFSWIDLGDADEAEVVAGLAERRSRSARARRSATPATCASPTAPTAENERFLAALGELLGLNPSTIRASRATTCAVKRTGDTTSSLRATGAALDSARYAYFWRFS